MTRPRTTKQRYDIVMGAINESVYDWDIARNRFWTSESMQRLLGLSPERLTLEGWQKSIHPDDYGRFRDGTIAHLKGKTERFECEYRYRGADGSWRWARTHGLAVRDRKGRAVRMIGSTGDITDLKRAEERYQLATSAAIEGIYEWDIPTGRLFVSDRAKALFMLPAEELTTGAWNSRVHGDDFAGYRQAIIDHFKGRTPQLEHEYRIADGQGGYRWVLERGIGVRDAAGRVIRMVGALSDITRRKRVEVQLQKARDRAEQALEQQTATAEVLKVTTSSPTDVQPVFEAILANALRLCEASFAAVFTFDGELLRNVAHLNASPEFARFLGSGGVRPSRETTTRRCALERRTIHTPDLMNDPEFSPPEAQRREKVRTSLSVPMFREGTLVGVISLWRAEVRPFTDKQIALVETFAAQAVIALENVRLFDETRQALEQQTATAEILGVISRSPTDTQPVFDAIVQSGLKLFSDAAISIALPDGAQIRAAAVAESDAQRAAAWRGRFPFPLTREYMHGIAILEHRIVDLPDVRQAPAELAAGSRNFLESGYRAITIMPMMHGERAIGALSVVRLAPGPLSAKQLVVLKTFADQAVIAVENVRLFNETREALEQQTATAEILEVTARSPSDGQPVFDAIARAAVRLCDGAHCSLYQLEGGLQYPVAHHGLAPEMIEHLERRYRRAPHPQTVTGYAILRREVVHIEDARVDQRFPESHPTQHLAGDRAVLAVPMVKDEQPVGVILVGRREPRPFSDRQIALLKTFADQAVIAVESVRLFNETKEALDQQTAAAEVLKAISGSLTDAQPVFEAILTHASRLCQATVATVFLYRDGVLINVAQRDASPEFGRFMRASRAKPSPDTTCRRCALERRTIHTADLLSDPRFSPPDAHHAEGMRTVLSVPMMREETLIGVLTVWRKEVRPFTAKQIALVETFASQAVIAIENVRLFNETKESLERQTATAEVLRVMSQSQTDVQPVLDAIARSAVGLCEGLHCSLFRLEGGLQHFVGHHGVEPDTVEVLRKRYPRAPHAGTVTGRALLERAVLNLEDVQADERFAESRAVMGNAGYRAVLAVPMFKQGEPAGVIFVVRREARAFSDKQVELLRTFADQAVIAIENVRLFNETREALEQQKASGEVLEAISGSIADTAPVFDKILESCQRLFAGTIVGLNLVHEDGRLHIGAYQGAHREEFERIFPIPLTLESGSGLSILERRVVHYPDASRAEVPERTQRGCRAIGVKSVIFAPVLWEGRGLGAIFVGRDHASTFSEKDIALLRTFTDQAAIAIENARLFREIQEKSRQLEIASRHKSEFLANMSHELRTPLNAIIGFTRIVMRRSQQALEPQQYENLEKILSSGHNLLALINSVLDLSKVEAGRVEVQPAQVELAPVLDQCLRTIEPLVKVTLVREFDGGLPGMYVDEEKLRQIVINLLSNAAKFTERGTIRLRARAANGSVAITVADTGIGIAADKLGLIFEEFEQAHAGSPGVHGGVYGGTGLGLTIARRLARLMGGDIDVESALGTGSRFTLTLPLRYPA